MRTREAAAWLGAVVLAGVLAACGDEGPEELQKAASEPAGGTHRVTCSLASDHGRVRLALDLPDGFVKGLPDPDELDEFKGCAWHRPVKVPDDSNFDGDPTTQDTFDSDVVVTLSEVRKGSSVDAYHDSREPDAVEGDDPEGDDSILHLKRTEGVPAFGSTIGDRLSYLCFCDGQNTIHRYAEADGILLTWDSELPLQKQTDRQLAAVLAGAGTVG